MGQLSNNWRDKSLFIILLICNFLSQIIIAFWDFSFNTK